MSNKNQMDTLSAENADLSVENLQVNENDVNFAPLYITKLINMCTISMTFEVPDSKHIDVEALKKQVNAFVSALIAMPNVELQNKEKKKYDISVFDSLSNDWNIEEEDIRKARKNEWLVESC